MWIEDSFPKKKSKTSRMKTLLVCRAFFKTPIFSSPARLANGRRALFARSTRTFGEARSTKRGRWTTALACGGRFHSRAWAASTCGQRFRRRPRHARILRTSGMYLKRRPGDPRSPVHAGDPESPEDLLSSRTTLRLLPRGSAIVPIQDCEICESASDSQISGSQAAAPKVHPDLPCVISPRSAAISTSSSGRRRRTVLDGRAPHAGRRTIFETASPCGVHRRSSLVLSRNARAA